MNGAEATLAVCSRVQNAEMLLIKRIAAETSALIGTGANIINLSQGVPNLPIFDAAKQQVETLLSSKLLPYADVPGAPEARAVAAEFVNRLYSTVDRPLALGPQNVLICAGAIQAIHDALSLVVEGPQDVVCTPLPAYGLYKHQTQLLGGTFEALPTRSEESFLPTAAELRALPARVAAEGVPGRRLRALVLCLPNNPTGWDLSPAKAAELASALDDAVASVGPQDGFAIILDEVYLGTTAPGAHASLLQYLGPRALAHTFLVLSCSKGLGAMPGARAAWLTCMDPALIDHAAKVQLATSGNASTLAQAGLLGSLRCLLDDPALLPSVHAHYATRVALLEAGLNDTFTRHGVEPPASVASSQEQPSAAGSSRPSGIGLVRGTFYVFADFSGWRRFGLTTDLEVVKLLKDMHSVGPSDGGCGAGVAVVPGCAFALDPSQMRVRFSAARDEAQLREAVRVVDCTMAWLKQRQPQQPA